MWQSKTIYRVICACVAAFTAVAGASVAGAACYSPSQQLPAAEVELFLSNPAEFLSSPAYRTGGGRLISKIRDLAASNPATLSVILGLLSGANAEQQTAIGAGLGQAALVCVKPDQPYYTAIQQAISGPEPNKQIAYAAFSAVLADAPIGGTGGGAGGGGAGGGGESATNPTPSTVFASSSSSSPFGPFGTKTIPFSATFGSGPTFVAGTSGGGGSVTVSRSVSPH
jgi:hypothetical protein